MIITHFAVPSLENAIASIVTCNCELPKGNVITYTYRIITIVNKIHNTKYNTLHERAMKYDTRWAGCLPAIQLAQFFL